MRKAKLSSKFIFSKSSRSEMGKLKTGSDLYLRDDLCAIKVFEKIHQLSLSQQQPDAEPPDREYNVVRPESQVEPVYANEMDPSSSGASPPAVKSPKSPAAKPLPPPSKPPKPKPTKAPKPKPEPKPNNVESPTGDAAGGSYDMNECPYAVLDTESLNKPMPGSQPNRKPKPSLPPTSESDGDQTQQQQPPQQQQPQQPTSSDGAAGAAGEDDVIEHPVYADIIGVLKQ
ncbi:hypothetical protein BOX15_Mlig014716g1 [Macrostomum lignano]|uniref:Uncharacterized protein n=2 Tax=Macrostomum lignano TaxID=282301 RepID=A0A267FPN7_9PLAT|nr:hypothetical protein BOX15_Mlig014716g1 [Macrostomum lignano]